MVQIGWMPKEITISKFKAICLAVLENVRRTGVPVRVTKFGKPVADVAATRAEPSEGWLGSMAGSAEVVGDICGPVGAFAEWGGGAG
jgi:antitoxin (DNA-binding transcriptional repressor) of toxin-antitoxin stability system